MSVTDTTSPGAATGADDARHAREERIVRDGFWPKVRATLGKVPFTEEAVAAFYCATDRSTPTYVRAVLFGALAYFVMPADLIPDFIAGLGFTDDATVLMGAFAAVRKHLMPEHHTRARAFLMNDAQPDS